MPNGWNSIPSPGTIAIWSISDPAEAILDAIDALVVSNQADKMTQWRMMLDDLITCYE